MTYTDRIGHAYFFAKNYIISRGYWTEIEWQDNISYSTLTKQEFLQEVSWVILASGLSDRIVQKKFPLIREAMFNFTSASLIAEKKEECFKNALREFNHVGKISAIISVSERIANQSIEMVKALIDRYDVDYLKTFPYVGETTAFHLAKNIGLNVAKPDRHLVRISLALGFPTPADLCRKISEELGEKVALVDLVLWRYATLDKQYLEKITWLIRK
jgi:3-methyladenine DNA glycosylase Tag